MSLVTSSHSASILEGGRGKLSLLIFMSFIFSSLEKCTYFEFGAYEQKLSTTSALPAVLIVRSRSLKTESYFLFLGTFG